MSTTTRIRPFLLFVLLASLPLCGLAAGADKKPLRLEEIFSDAGLLGRMPTQLRWSPDGRLLSYILQADEGEERNLWVVDAASGEKRVLVSYEELSKLAPAAEQATADERERERLLRYSVAAYVWSPDSKSILFTSAGQLYLFDLAAGKARLLAPAKRAVDDPKFSPDGKLVSFVYQHDLWAVPVAGGEEKRLTVGGNENVLHGDLDWVYPEEFELRTGYHWAPDSRRLAFLEIDQHPVPTYPISDLVAVQAPVDAQRYPKAGDPNPKVRVGIVDVQAALTREDGASGAETIWLDRVAEYIPRLAWVNAKQLAVQLLDRAQQELELVVAEAASGRSRSVLTERDPFWINITNDLKFLSGGSRFLWTSERTGFRHIYLYTLNGELVGQLTGTHPRSCQREGVPVEPEWLCSGGSDWEVGQIVGVDEENGWVYYTANEANTLGSNLYRVGLDGGKPELLTAARGTHTIVMNSAANAFADTESALTTLPELRLHHLPSGRTTRVHSARALDAYQMLKPELVEFDAPDGALVRGMLLKPPSLERGRRYPVVMYVYGGPHAPTIRDAWLGNHFLFHQYLAQQGFVVFYVDDRASSIPGHSYEAALHRNFGPTALADHRVAVAYLRSLPFVDPGRIALWGWSGGGFSTCFALTHSDLFRVGIAVAPVTDWHLYDSIYTERYMGLPAQEAEAYRKTSAVEAASNLRGRLLLVHGDADDNVHIQNTIRFIDALIQAGQPYDLTLYPRKTHALRGASTQLHVHRTIADYLRENLQAGPPAD